MANVNECIIAVKWKFLAGSNAPDLIALPAGCSWEDVTGQPAENLPCTPNVMVVRAFLTDAAYTAVNGNAAFIVLARRVYDDASPNVYTSNNYTDAPTTAQLTTLRNLITARFPDVNVSKLADLVQGKTRIEMLQLLLQRWRAFAKA